MAAHATFASDSRLEPRVDPRLDPRLEMKGFFVHVEGAVPVGPVSASQIARGLRAGKIPSEATVQWEGEVFWRDIFDEPAVIAALKAL